MLTVNPRPDRSSYDTFLETETASIEQTRAWSVPNESGWDDVTRILLTDDHGDIVAACQFFERQLPGGPMLYCPGGPVVRENDADHWAAVAESLRSYFKDRRVSFAKISPRSEYRTDSAAAITAAGFRASPPLVSAEGTFRVDLLKKKAVLRENLHGNWKRALNNSQVAVTHEQRPETVIDRFYPLYQRTAKRKRFRPVSKRFFRRLFDVFGENAHLFTATHEGNPVAGSIILSCGTTAWMEDNWSSKAAWSLRPNQKLEWTILLWLKRNGYRQYDLKGSPYEPDETHPNFGLYLFKRGLGGKHIRHLGEYDYVGNRAFYTIWRRLLPLYLKLFHQSLVSYYLGLLRNRSKNH